MKDRMKKKMEVVLRTFLNSYLALQQSTITSGQWVHKELL